MVHINMTANKKKLDFTFTASVSNGLIQTHKRQQQFGLCNCSQKGD